MSASGPSGPLVCLYDSSLSLNDSTISFFQQENMANLCFMSIGG